MDAQKALTVRRITPADAAQALAGLEALDPRGLTGPGDIERMTQDGQCFALSGAVHAVYVMTVKNGVAWVDAIHATSDPDRTALAAAVAVMVEQAAGLDAIACQTARPGMVRKLQRLGWHINGWILKKSLT